MDVISEGFWRKGSARALDTNMPLQGDISPHVQWSSVFLSEALLAHDGHVCIERPSGALPPEGRGFVNVISEGLRFRGHESPDTRSCRSNQHDG